MVLRFEPLVPERLRSALLARSRSGMGHSVFVKSGRTLNLRLVVQNDIQQCAVNFDAAFHAAVVK